MWRVSSIFELFVLPTGNRVLNSLYYLAIGNLTFVSKLFDSNMFTRQSSF